MSSKEQLRGKIKELLKPVPGKDFHSQGETAAALLFSSPIWAFYKVVYIFLSINSEINTQSLFEAALREGKKVFVPGIIAERLVFFPILSPDGPWCIGPFGIREPALRLFEGEGAGHELSPALILTPGLAFDRNGNRLGRGKGYYDRFFAELDKKGGKYFALGLCMDFQVIDQVPADENDKKMDAILTGKTLIYPVTCKRLY